MKLRTFIGSAFEDLNIANAIKYHLQPELDCVVWNEPGVFKLSKTPLSSILELIEDYDVGIFVFGAHDKTTSRKKTFVAARDNVVFEHGLFAGRLGSDRALVVRDKAPDLKWPSDLKGFTPVLYDSITAGSDAQKALESACDELKSHLRNLIPTACISLSGKRRPIGQGWWTYALVNTAKNAPSTLPSTYTTDAEGFEFTTNADIGVRFPQRDTLTEMKRYCAFRIKATHPTANRRLYVAMKPGYTDTLLGHGETYLALSDSYDQAGWGSPSNEFQAKLPDLTDGQWHRILIDFSQFVRFIGEQVIVKGFRLRPGLKVSHICTFGEKPIWLRDAEEILPDGAPYIKIKRPNCGDHVDFEERVEGDFTGSGSLQAAVFSGTMWHPQGRVEVGPSGNWTAKCRFGYPPDPSGKSGSSETHKLAILTGEHPIKQATPTLPDALGRDCILVKRR